MSNAEVGLSILGGGTSASSLTGLQAFRKYNSDPVAARKAFFNREDVQRSIDAFKRGAAKLKDIDDLLGDRKTLQFVLTAFGLESEATNPGKIKAILKSDPDDPNSYANRLTDPRFAELNKFVNFPIQGVSKLQDSSAQSQIVDKYLTNAFEIDIGKQSPAAREALYFLRRINEVDSSLEILGDLPLRSIVTTALNLPQEIARQSVLKQQSLLDAKLDFDKLNTISTDTEKPKTRADYLNEDIGRVTGGLTAVAKAESQLNSIQTKLESLRTKLSDYNSFTDTNGVLQAEIPIQEAAIPDLIRQRGLIAAASQAAGEASPLMKRLEAIYDRAAEVDTQEELDSLKSEFDDLVTEIAGTSGIVYSATYTDSTAGTTENLFLPSGDVGAGIDAVPSSTIATVVKADGTAVVTNAYDLSTFISKLNAANSNFQAITLGALSSGIATSETDFTTAKTEFSAATVRTNVNASSFDNTVKGVSFAYELNTAELASGISAVDDALGRLGTVDSLLAEIKSLALAAQQPSADIADLDAKYRAKVDALSSAINTAGSATDGTSTISFDNLLTGGTQTYTADTASGTTIDARGGALQSVLLSGLPANLSVGNAGSIISDVDTTFRDAVDDLRSDLRTDRQVFDFAANKADPLGAIDAEIRTLRNELDATIAKAESNGNNLLGEFAKDIKIALTTLGTNLTVDAQTYFKGDFEDALSSLQYVSLNGGAAADRESLLNDALFAVGRAAGRLRAEKFTLQIQQTILSEQKASSGKPEETLSFFKPGTNTEYAVKFIEQYLIKLDMQAVGGSTQAQPKNAALVGLIQNIAGSGGLNLNLLT